MKLRKMMVIFRRELYEEDSVYLKKGDVKEVRASLIYFCCDEMKKGFEENFVGFGDYDKLLNKIETVNIYRCSPYPEGAVFDCTPISFCPFCGSPIEVMIGKEFKEFAEPNDP